MNDFPENVQFIEGDSIASETIAQVQRVRGGRRTMLFADGSRAAEHVFKELVLYGSMVSPGCYYVVEDGIVDLTALAAIPTGALVALQRLLAAMRHGESLSSSRHQFLQYKSESRMILKTPR